MNTVIYNLIIWSGIKISHRVRRKRIYSSILHSMLRNWSLIMRFLLLNSIKRRQNRWIRFLRHQNIIRWLLHGKYTSKWLYGRTWCASKNNPELGLFNVLLTFFRKLSEEKQIEDRKKQWKPCSASKPLECKRNINNELRIPNIFTLDKILPC